MKDIHFNNRNNASFLLLLSGIDKVDITPISVELLDNDNNFVLDNDNNQIIVP